MTLYDSGIRPVIDAHLKELSEQKREYGDYWSASSAGYCYRKVMFDRLRIPPVQGDARKQRVFSSGDIFHQWIQEITKSAGLSIAQELELQDEDFMIRGHVDDLVLIRKADAIVNGHLILYDYKTAHSKWFEYAKTRPVSYYNKMQVGTYMYILRKNYPQIEGETLPNGMKTMYNPRFIDEARILKISKDDLRLFEYQVLWTEELEKEVKNYWLSLNISWNIFENTGKLPPCTCADYENGFLAKEKWNPYYFNDKPCSLDWFNKWKEENVTK